MISPVLQFFWPADCHLCDEDRVKVEFHIRRLVLEGIIKPGCKGVQPGCPTDITVHYHEVLPHIALSIR